MKGRARQKLGHLKKKKKKEKKKRKSARLKTYMGNLGKIRTKTK
jgi:hypothetical protein